MRQPISICMIQQLYYSKIFKPDVINIKFYTSKHKIIYFTIKDIIKMKNTQKIVYIEPLEYKYLMK